MSDFIRGPFKDNANSEEGDPLTAGLGPELNHRPEEKPAEEFWQARAAAYWRARGVMPTWARRADDAQPVTRAELRSIIDELLHVLRSPSAEGRR